MARAVPCGVDGTARFARSAPAAHVDTDLQPSSPSPAPDSDRFREPKGQPMTEFPASSSSAAQAHYAELGFAPPVDAP